MWQKLKQLFSPTVTAQIKPRQVLWFRRPGAPDPLVHGIVPPPPFPYDRPDSWRGSTGQHLLWIEAQDSEFGVRCLDCRPFSHAMISTMQEQVQLDQYTAGRTATGAEHRGKDPPDAQARACALGYPFHGERHDGALVRSMMLEDKWDAFLWEDSLYFVRSWTGALVHRARVEFSAGRVTLRAVASAADADMGDETLPIREVDFLLRTLLCRQLLPHPLPAGFPDEPQAIAQHSFSRHGRFAYFATYEDLRERLRPTAEAPLDGAP